MEKVVLGRSGAKEPLLEGLPLHVSKRKATEV